MAAVLLDASVVTLLKSALSQMYCDIKSAHLSEALAKAMGFTTNRALHAAFEQVDGTYKLAVLDDERFVDRLAKLGYPNQPYPHFDEKVGAEFGDSNVEYSYPEEVLRGLGGEHMDLYYLCVTLQSLGDKLPGYLSFSSIRSRLVKHQLVTPDGFTRYNLRDWISITNRLAEKEDDDLPPLPPIQAHDDYVGTVSFRADVPGDIEVLFDILRARFPRAWRRTNAADEEAVEMVISGPLHISILHKTMFEVQDGHIMVETLRALPLDQNNLERRYSESRPRDWASLDDEDLVDDDDESDGPVMR